LAKAAGPQKSALDTQAKNKPKRIGITFHLIQEQPR
jgi:hypothetical protein